MIRHAIKDLMIWKDNEHRKPLMLRGARQVGKSHLAREFGKNFENFIEINFEENPSYIEFFEGDIVIEKLLLKFEVASGKKVIPQKTLLFLDEIQNCPRAIIALRYFYEKLPALHIISAGSLLEFTLEEIGIPVGRITSLYLYPMTFMEFLDAIGESKLKKLLIDHDVKKPLDNSFHDKLLEYIKEYFFVGGMPEAVNSWISQKDISTVKNIHNDLIDTFKQDFSKYAKKNQVPYLEKIFTSISLQLGHKFIFNRVDDSLKTRELRPALELLEKAQIIKTIHHSSGNGIPLGAEADHSLFKVIMLDIALTQTLLGIDIKDIFLNFDQTFINKGEIAEAFVGQELMAYSNNKQKSNLYFWQREKPKSMAEIDYLISKNQIIYPIEVKSSEAGHLKSLKQFLTDKKKNNHQGIHISTKNFYSTDSIQGIPLYAVFKLLD